MRAAFRRFLLSCLMLMLPLQAFASTAMLGCALTHPDAVAAPAPACHDETPAQPAPSADHDCVHCAVCCLSAALLIPAPAAAPAERPPTVYPHFVSRRFDGFIPDGPERPPRSRPAVRAC
jgi:hypothetical protein